MGGVARREAFLVFLLSAADSSQLILSKSISTLLYFSALDEKLHRYDDGTVKSYRAALAGSYTANRETLEETLRARLISVTMFANAHSPPARERHDFTHRFVLLTIRRRGVAIRFTSI